MEIVHGYQEDTFLTGLFSMRKLNDLDFIRDSMRASLKKDFDSYFVGLVSFVVARSCGESPLGRGPFDVTRLSCIEAENLEGYLLCS